MRYDKRTMGYVQQNVLTPGDERVMVLHARDNCILTLAFSFIFFLPVWQCCACCLLRRDLGA